VSAGFVARQEHKDEIVRLIEEKIGKTMDVDVRQVEEGRRFEDSFVDIEKVIHMDITVEDF
jgi:DNA polymerase-3 subunit gamma/tau